MPIGCERAGINSVQPRNDTARGTPYVNEILVAIGASGRAVARHIVIAWNGDDPVGGDADRPEMVQK